MTTTTAHQLDQDQALLTELRILASIRAQDRIATNFATRPVIRIQRPDFFRPVVRFFGSENRVDNMTYVQSLLQRVIDRHTMSVHLEDTALGQRIQEETQRAIIGIRRLQQTYQDDAQFQAGMNVAVDTVCLHLEMTPWDMQPVKDQPSRQNFVCLPE